MQANEHPAVLYPATQPFAEQGNVTAAEDHLIHTALAILARRMRQPGDTVGSPAAVKAYLQLQLAAREREVFAVLWLDVRNRVIAYEEMFAGSLVRTQVHPREIVKKALTHNAAAVIVAHNHPSGDCTASPADRTLTQVLASALALIEVKVLDHIIVAGTVLLSFAEMGYL